MCAMICGERLSLSADGEKVAFGFGGNDDDGDHSDHVRVLVMECDAAVDGTVCCVSVSC